MQVEGRIAAPSGCVLWNSLRHRTQATANTPHVQLLLQLAKSPACDVFSVLPYCRAHLLQMMKEAAAKDLAVFV